MILLYSDTSSWKSIWQLVSVIIVFLIVLGLTYLSTKWIAGYQKGQSANKNLQIIETLRLTNNKYIQIIEAGEEYLVIAIGKDEVHFLTKLTREQMKVLPEEMLSSGTKDIGESFQEILEKIKGRMPKK